MKVLFASYPVNLEKVRTAFWLLRAIPRSNPFKGALYMLRAKRADLVKIVSCDGIGVCLHAKLARRPNGQKKVKFDAHPLSPS
ncbi:IS66 family insertion sequence element accessory protein TnpB [Mesorhizobium sp.]|uniref:IS66 family insertion sequence element accessory protein TnpB n=1 Tax=Mesorhizobium sp. TaxID=1871066 RepID=UPI001208D899|nr:IS66 family insertion sequence element accessory protein TnpB [Mesorhizobium sp.]TIL29607.1 MAG: transposase [Mesorhizobium sp.]